MRQRSVVTHITPLRGKGLSAPPGGLPSQWCGARLQTGVTSAQSLVLVGVGVTEALSCDGIKAFGAVPAAKGTERIAFIYRGSSPNTRGASTVVIIERASRPTSCGWAVHHELSYNLDQIGTLTSLPAIRAFLAKYANSHLLMWHAMRYGHGVHESS